MWKQRAACVTLVNVARFGAYNEDILFIVKNTVKNRERFVQLGTGWLLREFYLADKTACILFIKENYMSLSREGLRYACEKMPVPLQRELREFKPLVDDKVKREKKRKREPENEL